MKTNYIAMYLHLSQIHAVKTTLFALQVYGDGVVLQVSGEGWG